MYVEVGILVVGVLVVVLFDGGFSFVVVFVFEVVYIGGFLVDDEVVDCQFWQMVMDVQVVICGFLVVGVDQVVGYIDYLV